MRQDIQEAQEGQRELSVQVHPLYLSPTLLRLLFHGLVNCFCPKNRIGWDLSIPEVGEIQGWAARGLGTCPRDENFHQIP